MRIISEQELKDILDNHGKWLQNEAGGARANLLTFQYQKHLAYFTADGTLQIGCHQLPIYEGLETFKEIGKYEGYSATEIKLYGQFIKLCADKFKADNPWSRNAANVARSSYLLMSEIEEARKALEGK